MYDVLLCSLSVVLLVLFMFCGCGFVVTWFVLTCYLMRCWFLIVDVLIVCYGYCFAYMVIMVVGGLLTGLACLVCCYTLWVVWW